MRVFVQIMVIILTFVSCSNSFNSYEGYTKHEKGYWYKLHSFEEGYIKAKNTDFVSAELQFSIPNNDSLVFTDSYIIQVSNTDSVCLPLMLHDVKQGDSISFIAPNTRCIRNVLPAEFFDLFSDGKELQITAKILWVNDAITYEKKVKEYAIWLASKLEFEKNYIQTFISKHSLTFTLQNGIYKSIVKPGTGKIPQNGDIVSIRYQGSVLSGEIINHFTSLEFVYGSQWQVIEGIEKALATMKQGERAVIIVPSEFAWGEKGTSDGSIPPFTTVQFDLELVSVTQK